MGGPRTPRCRKKSEHDWKPVRGGARERCTKCGDVFPCRSNCDHLDCIVATGRPVPDYYANPEQARENMLAELAETSPTVYAAILKARRKRTRKPPAEAPSPVATNPAAPIGVKTVNGLTRDQLEAQLASAIERKALRAENAIRAHLRLFDGAK